MDRDPIAEYGGDLAVVTVLRSAVPLDPFLGSLRAATARPARVIVADSTGPGSPDIGVPDVEILRMGEDVGRAAATNRAVAALDASVGWVALADPTVRWCPGSIDTLVDAGARHPRAGALGPRLRGLAGEDLPSGGALPGLVDALLGRVPTGNAAGPTGWLSASCLLLRRSAWDSVDGFDPRYVGACDDVDLGDRLGRAGWLNVGVPAAEVQIRGTDPAGMLEASGVGLRRFVRDRGRAPSRVLLAVAGAVHRP